MTDTIKITLSERRPVTIATEEWPVIAEASAHDGAVPSQANRTYLVRVREHRDGRRIVYGWLKEGPGGMHRGEREAYAGYIVDDTNGTPNDAETIRAIRRVAGCIDRDDLGAECIGELPAETL